MRSITLDQIHPGMYLSQPLIAADGTVLLHEGIAIRERYIQYLRNKGITSLFIGEPAVENIVGPAEDFYDPKHQQEAMAAARETINHFRVGKGVDLSRVKDTVSLLMDQLAQNPENMARFLDLRRKEEYLFSNAVNTFILSAMTGLVMGYDERQLGELGLAAMLHDIGKTKLSKKLALQFPDYLTKAAKEEYRRHPFYSMEILRESSGISAEVINACFQHHERWNGSGYPMGLKGDNISEYAQIISIADAYDRLVVGLPHRLPTPVYYAAAILNKAAGAYFNPAIIDMFTQNLVLYPMGKMVRLSNRQSGLVLGVGIDSKTTPVVRITSSQDSSSMNQLIELDLEKNPGLFIVDFIETHSIYAQAYADQSYVYPPKILKS